MYEKRMNLHSPHCGVLKQLIWVDANSKVTHAEHLLMFTAVGGSRLQAGSSVPDITVCFHLFKSC